MLTIQCDFPETAKFHAKYQRNNKKTGLKNLRCYPFCGPDDKHHQNGFCGSAVRVCFSLSGGNDLYSLNNLQAWGEFICKTENPNRYPIGSIVPRSEIDSLLRTDAVHVNPLFDSRSSIVVGDVKQFSFESQKKGWNYDWKGNKYTSDLPHAFRVYLAIPFTADTYQFIGVFASPSFTMFCRRRHNTVPEAEKLLLATPLLTEERTLQVPLVDGRVSIIEHKSVILPPPPKKASSSSTKKKEKKATGSSSSSSTTTSAKREKSSPSPKKKKAKTDKDNTSDMKLIRILAAISNLDKLKKRLQQDLEPDINRIGNTSEELDIRWLEEALGGGGDLFSSDDLGLFRGTVDDIFEFDSSEPKVSTDRIKAVEVVESLARYLVDEENFTAAINKSVVHSSYADFIQLIQTHVSEFLRENFDGMSVDDLDAALRGETSTDTSSSRKEIKSAFETLVSAALMRDGDEEKGKHSLSSSPSNSFNDAASSSVLSNKPFLDELHLDNSTLDVQFPPGIVLADFLRPPKPLGPEDEFPDVSGVWIRPDVATAEMEKWRERRDLDWVSRQMLSKMEKKFAMTQPSRNQLFVQLSKKLLSSGYVVYELDAVERPFSMTSPLGQNTLAKTMVAWAVGPAMCLRHSYSDTERLTRCNWKVGPDELHGVHIYQSRGGAWTETSKDNDGLLTEDSWRVVHVMTQICQRDKTASKTTSTGSEVDDWPTSTPREWQNGSPREWSGMSSPV